MVDVSPKIPSMRSATASGRIFIPKIAYDLISTSFSPNLTEHPDHSAAAKRETNSTSSSSSSSSSLELEKAKAKARAKGDVLTVAQLAAIMGCKRTAELIPLCHPLQLSHISVFLRPEYHGPFAGLRSGPRTSPTPEHSSKRNDDERVHNEAEANSELPTLEDPLPSHYSVMCSATVSCEGKTGVEMEALTAVSVGLLTVWDMLKAVAGKEMVIGEILVESKRGGKSGDFERTHAMR